MSEAGSSDYSSSEYSESDASDFSDVDGAPGPAAAPRPASVPGLSLPQQQEAGTGPSSRPAPVPRLGVPSLGLGSTAPRSGSPSVAAGAGTSAVAPPRVPSLHMGGGGSPAPLTSRGHHNAPGSDAADGEDPPLAVQLVSFAFLLDPAAVAAGGERGAAAVSIEERCVRTLGIARNELTFYELREVPGEAIPSDCKAIGVAVNQSGFSLGEMETLLADNKRLATAADRNAAALESLQHLVREQHQTVTKAQMLAGEKARGGGGCCKREAETRRLQDRCKFLEKEVVALRHQLQRSDMLRLQGQMALDELKREFESLMHNILDGGDVHADASAMLSADDPQQPRPQGTMVGAP